MRAVRIVAVLVVLAAVATIDACRAGDSVRRRTWAVRVPVAGLSSTPPNTCLREVLSSRYGGTRGGQGQVEDEFGYRIFFRSPVAYHEKETWLCAGIIRDKRDVLEFSDDWVGAELSAQQQRELGKEMVSIVDAFYKSCLSVENANWSARCEAYPEGELCPLPEKELPRLSP
jgi:hypothetical protein